MSVRSLVKPVAEHVLLGSGAARASRSRHRARTLVLAYHNVVPDDASPAGDASLHLPRHRFAAQLDELARTHEVVPLDEILTPPTRGARRPRVALTFDDAYRGAVTGGVEELARRGLPATIFVAPAFVGGRSFWWDALADPRTGEVRPSVREHALRALRGEDARIRRWAGTGAAVTAVPAPLVGAGEEELHAAARVPGITFGSHTWGHPNLAALDPAEFDEELARPLAWLRARFDNVVSWLSYPYGLWSPAVARAAERAGYRGALRVEGGWVPRGDVPHFSVPRYNVPAGLSVRGFRLRIDGLLHG
jgi:peptidoglycan/xylan/chitin deacetylase (PgdA/CDA1 family)